MSKSYFNKFINYAKLVLDSKINPIYIYGINIVLAYGHGCFAFGTTKQEELREKEEENVTLKKKMYERQRHRYTEDSSVYIIMNNDIKDKFKFGESKNITALFFKTGHSNYKLFSVYNFLL